MCTNQKVCVFDEGWEAMDLQISSGFLRFSCVEDEENRVLCF